MSAYIIDTKLYVKFANILYTLISDKTSKEIVSVIPWFIEKNTDMDLSDKYDPNLNSKIIQLFIQKMIQMNYESVGYRYNEPEHPPEMAEAMEEITPKENSAFLAYGKPQDYLEVAQFLNCWNYQSCEKNDSVTLTEKNKALFKTVEELKSNLLKRGLERATNHKGSWGYLELSTDKPAAIA